MVYCYFASSPPPHLSPSPPPPQRSFVRIRGTTFLSSIAELLPIFGTQSEMKRKYKGDTKINTTINHRRTTTRARTNAGVVKRTGMDGEGGKKNNNRP